MRKINYLKSCFAIITLLCIVALHSEASAISFNSLQKLGLIRTDNIPGFIFEGESNNIAVSDIKYRRMTVYTEGKTTFGSSDHAIRFHYKTGDYNNKKRITKFGDINLDNTVDVEVLYSQLSYIPNNSPLSFYMIHGGYDLPEEHRCTLIGKNGKYVKYFDSKEICNRYIGPVDRVWSDNSIWIYDWGCSGDTIILKYKRFSTKLRNEKHIGEYYTAGEFRFKWDDTAQWFGIEHVVY